jgi:uncharacterized membrane protein
MKRSLAAALSAVVLLAGCAPYQYTKANVDGRKVCDDDAVARVEEAARRNNIFVQWVNCPVATLRVI